MKRALLLVSVTSLIATGAATAATTPAQYRAHLNTVCRSYTPKLKKLEAVMTTSSKAGDSKTYGVALGMFLVLGLDQDAQIEKAAVPATLKTQMSSIFATYKQADVHVHTALAAAKAGNAQKMVAELRTVQKIAAPLNAKLDAAGLRDCGSNQQ